MRFRFNERFLHVIKRIRSFPSSYRIIAVALLLFLITIGLMISAQGRGTAPSMQTKQNVPLPSSAQTAEGQKERKELIHKYIFPNTLEALLQQVNKKDSFISPAGADQEDEEIIFARILANHAKKYPSPDDVEFAFIPKPDTSLNPKYQAAAFRKYLNIEILLDASGSMKEPVMPGIATSKWEVAVSEIRKLVGQLPEKTNVSLRVFGQAESADQEQTCRATEQVFTFSEPDESRMTAALEKFTPTGDTPLAYALGTTRYDFEGKEAKENANFIFVVTDGMETCGGDPVASAKELKDSSIEPFFHIIGFGVNAEEDQSLRTLATSVDALYARVQDMEAFHKQFEELINWAEQWRKWSELAREELWLDRLKSTVVETGYVVKWGKVEGKEVEAIETAIDNMVNRGEIKQEMKKRLLQIMERRIDHLHQLREEARRTLEKRRLALYRDLNSLATTPPSDQVNEDGIE